MFKELKGYSRADILFKELLNGVKDDFEVDRWSTIKEIIEFIPQNQIKIGETTGYGYALKCMFSNRQKRDYFIFEDESLPSVFARQVADNDRSYYKWIQEYGCEKVKISDRYIDLIPANILIDKQMKYEIEVEKQDYYKILKEGRPVEYYTKRYERNLKNRMQAIKYHGLNCEACGFDFKKVYGEYGKSFIEIHHTKPLSFINEEIEVNPKTDLIPLCANCHRMVHRKKNEVLTIGELKELIKSNLGEPTL
ncbi:HNH endonuclease [Niallia taxi]|uniref:HNH endonuclease n=1 Tax=Niallia taxi TaxID=2499688 RepID=UPI003F602AA5